MMIARSAPHNFTELSATVSNTADPITGQGSNNAAKSGRVYLKAHSGKRQQAVKIERVRRRLDAADL
jgi:hypothetical protein